MKCSKWGRTTVVLLFIMIAPVFSHAQTAYADSVVSVCDDAHLHTAVSGGGTITFSCSGTIILNSSLIVSSNTTIDGSGQSITISGGDTVQAIVVNTSETLNLKNLTISNGGASGIYNDGGTVNIDHCIFSSNSGWGVYNYGNSGSSTTLNVINSTFTTNFSGGIQNWGNAYTATVTVDNSIFSNNSAWGIYTFGKSNLTVTDSTFSGNQYDGISNNGMANIMSSTFFSNTHSGIVSFSGSTLSTINSTFASNGEWGIVGYGMLSIINSTFSGNAWGGISNSGVLTIENTLVANSGTYGNCMKIGTMAAFSTHNLADDSTCGSSFTVSNQIKLGSLANNGGPTYTMALLPGSAAIDAGDNVTCLDPNTVANKDQRGIVRITQQDPVCDIGAYEALLDRVFLPFIRRW